MAESQRLFYEEHINFLREHAEGVSNQDLTDMFNARFGTNYKMQAIRKQKFKHGIYSGIKHIPSYTDGKPIGSIRIKERRQYIKIAPHKWVQLHNHIWEQANGPIPKGHVLIFGDGDFLNTDLDNLVLVTRKQLLILNSNNLIKDRADFTKIGVMIADLLVAAKTNKL